MNFLTIMYVCNMRCSVPAVTLFILCLAAVCGGTWWPFSGGEEETVTAEKGTHD